MDNEKQEVKAAAPAAGKKLSCKKGKGTCVLKKKVSVPVVGLIVALLVVFGAAFFIGKGMGFSGIHGKVTISESELDKNVATYVSNGKSHGVTAREVLTVSGNLDNMKDKDGNYHVPSADSVLAFVRSRILEDAAVADGLQVNDEDIKAYAKSTFQTDDIDKLASQFGLSKEQAQQILKQGALTKKLYDKVTSSDEGAKDVPQQPAQPEQPAKGKEKEATEAYSKYIIGLLGDEWDANKNDWARTDGPFYKALSDLKFKPGKATFEQAQAAFFVAYQNYAESANKVQRAWTDYVNKLLSNSSLNLNEIIS